MMRLLLLRHAKAAPGGDDSARPLTARGAADAEALGRRLRAEGAGPYLVLCSPALRARETAAHMAPADLIHLVPELYLAESEGIFDVIRHFGAGAGILMVVGHNPGLGTCARTLAGEASACDGFPTCALADFSVSAAAWEALSPEACVLSRCLKP